MKTQFLENPNQVYSVKIISKELINHDVLKFELELPTKEYILGTKSGQHFFIIAEINGEKIIRKYTPTNLEDQTGHFEFIIKVYRRCEKFPDGGKMGQYLEALKVGDSINIQGPYGRCTYLHNGKKNFR